MAAPARVAGAGAPARLDVIDALRAVAALWVVMFHIGLWWSGAYWYGFDALARGARGEGERALVWVSRLGFHGVSLFLVLSGFCLYYPLVRRDGVAGARVEGATFAQRRVARVYPAYLASIVVLCALAWWPVTAAVVMRPITALDLVTHLTLVHNLVPSTLWTMNGAYWSLALEAQLYVVFPVMVFAARRLGVGALGALGLVTSALWLVVLRQVKPMGLTVEAYGVLHEALPGRLGEFCAGMVAAAVVAEGRRVPTWLLAAVALLWAPASHVVQLSGLFDHPYDRLVNGPSFAALIALACRAPVLVVGAPPMRLLVRIGVASYSLYLVHQPLLLVLRLPVHGLRLGPWALVASGLAASIVVGAAFHALFEAPAGRLLEPRKKMLAQGEGVA